MRTHIRKVEEAISAGDKDLATQALRQAEPKIVRSAQKGILHKRAAARKSVPLVKAGEPAWLKNKRNSHPKFKKPHCICRCGFCFLVLEKKIVKES